MNKEDPLPITEILNAVNDGQKGASDRLFSLVYNELRRMARSKMKKESPGHTLQPTALVHEAYIRLLSGNTTAWKNRAHFFSAAGEAMRRILIDHARKKMSRKRPASRSRIDLDETLVLQEPQLNELLALDAALKRLEVQDRRMSDVLKLRFFVGLTVEQTAEALDTSPRTVDREWAAARAWLYRELRKDLQADL